MDSYEAQILSPKRQIVYLLFNADFQVLLLHYLEHGQCSCHKRTCTKPGQHSLVPGDKGSYKRGKIEQQLLETPRAGIGYVHTVPEFVPSKARLVYFRSVLEVVPEAAWALTEPAAGATRGPIRRAEGARS